MFAMCKGSGIHSKCVVFKPSANSFYELTDVFNESMEVCFHAFLYNIERHPDAIHSGLSDSFL